MATMNISPERAAKKAVFDGLIQEGRDSGISPLSLDEILAEARRRAADVKPVIFTQENRHGDDEYLPA